ncbi:methyltransferase domain-containing protein [Larkinella sp. VNQ87]|uniref:methyltransferase domain-containing protein n=1 Tax=Larkinella sp. VNQ87 TaxID=3400921 RepID=UPI003BFC059A
MKVFCSWSGRQSKELAQALKETFELILTDVELWISENDIKAGERWNESIAKNLEECNYGIAFITEENIHEPWIHFESGAISKQVGKSSVCPYLFHVKSELISRTPLATFQALSASKDDTFKLLTYLKEKSNSLIKEENLRRSFNIHWESLSGRYTEIEKKYSHANDIAREKRDLDQVFRLLKSNPILNNIYLKEITINYIRDFIRKLKKSSETSQLSISIPHIFYPFFLTKLLENRRNALTKAISIVDNDENFWPEKTGDLIIDYTTRESIRIFAFRNQKQMLFHLPMLKKHAKKYNIYVISYSYVSNLYDADPYDFSIVGDINTPNSSMIAKYDDKGSSYKTIKFTYDEELLLKQNELFLKIKDQSIELDDSFDLDDEDKKNSFFDLVFNNISRLNNKPVEMSSYISIHEYHAHEEKHAYFVEMMERMINIYRDMSTKTTTPNRVLEMGAGTGIFTKRLLNTENINIVAIEIDWACYHLLLENMSSINGSSDRAPKITANGKLKNTFKYETINSVVECYNLDGRTFDPRGKFKFVFSSFADHHINKQDKRKYFKNVRENLEEGGVFIVGDEFLPSYDEEDSLAREKALRTYHNHIIDKTRERYGQEADGFVQLETAALESGIQGMGDFKLSCDQYERYLRESKFEIVSKDLIGPKDQSDVGGIYVYTLKAV